MTATDELRCLLDERGVKWIPVAWNPKRETFYHAANGVGFCADEYTDGVKIYTDATITPEQAIAATLGDADATSARQSVADLKDENAKMRNELDQWERLTANIELPEYPIAEFQPKDLERENAKLRELVHRLISHVEHPPCEGCMAEMNCDGEHVTQCDEWLFMVADARKLGVEVTA